MMMQAGLHVDTNKHYGQEQGPEPEVSNANKRINDVVQWSEIRLSGKLPERRSNHCSFIVNDYMYIHGGRDIKEGQMANMWKLSLPGVEELANDSNYGVQWEPVKDRGQTPGKISHHKAVVFGSSVIIYGGMSGINEITDVYEFDCNKEAWSKMKQSSNGPKPRDDHSLAKVDEERFIIFGGFVNGSRTNECWLATKQGSQLIWEQLAKDNANAPCPRASHSAAVYDEKMYIFGGQDDENNKLNDLWEFDINTQTYNPVSLPNDSYQPQPRSGHSSSICDGKMYLFGGILELTKELNELLAFDLQTMKFSLIGRDSHAYGEEENEHYSNTRPGEESPGIKGSNTLQSPSKTRKSMYPSISPSKKTASMMKPKVQIQT